MPEPKPLRKARIDKLSSEYHKAHKQVMLWAGILFIWELVGIDLENAKNAEGNVGAIVKSLKSPQAVPWVLLVLVGYFLLKTNIEWWQCDAADKLFTLSVCSSKRGECADKVSAPVIASRPGGF